MKIVSKVGRKKYRPAILDHPLSFIFNLSTVALGLGKKVRRSFLDIP
ncbi:MAG: hypothetical protein QME44_03365 [Thermodesulfobacteriota bacterium]|nr:hypothetical protein [Thermodesulfobacteriota bacterium]